MLDPIRVKAKDTGHEMTIPSARFDKAVFEKLDKPALDAHNEPAPVKYRTTPASSKPFPDGEPADTWKVAELEAYATEKGADIAGAKNNGERVALIAAATPASDNQAATSVDQKKEN